MLRIGAHMSVAGGLSKAVDRAVIHGCEALQIFSKNANRWQGTPLDPSEVRRFRTRLDEAGIAPAVSHASYLINLATTVPALRAQSVAALIDELDRAHALGLLGVVIHPGTCTAGTEDDGLRLIADAVRAAFESHRRRRTMVIFEHTAGQGRTLGHRFEHLSAIIEHLDGSPRVGVCLDTCHLVASGYDIATEPGYAGTFATFDRVVGIGRLRVVHANDSKRPCGSRVDRHEHIGQGVLGLEPFWRLLHDRRFAGLPLLIETEKSIGCNKPNQTVEDPLDAMNLATLRRLKTDRRPPRLVSVVGVRVSPLGGLRYHGGMHARATTLSVCLGLASLTTPPATAQEPAGLDVPPIRNFLRVNDQFCTGGQPRLEHLDQLKADGVRAIINLRAPTEHRAAEEEEKAKQLGLRYFNIPVVFADPKDQQVTEFLAITDDPANRPAFIHCTAAIRVGAFWMIRRVMRDGWTIEKAEEEARQVGLRESPHLNAFARAYVAAHKK